MKRDTWQFWNQEIRAWAEHMEGPLSDFQHYAQWFAGGDPSGRGDSGPAAQGTDPRYQPPEGNYLSLIVRVMRSDLLFRFPRYSVKPIEVFGDDELIPRRAEVETLLLNDASHEVNLYREGRACLLDGLLGPFMVMKVGFSEDIVLDPERHALQLDLARSEDMNITAADGRPRVKDTDLHDVHLDQHEYTLGLIERGDLKLPPKRVAYLRKHIEKHRETLRSQGLIAKETTRYQRVFNRRISPLHFFADPMADRPDDWTWVGEGRYRRVDEIQNDERYSPEVRARIKGMSQGMLPDHALDGRSNVQSHTAPWMNERITYEYDITDLRDNVVRTFAVGEDAPLREALYGHREIFPSGPYVLGSFFEHPLRNHGLAPPRAYEAEQQRVRDLDSHITEIVKRCKPFLMGNADVLPQEVQDKIINGESLEFLLLKGLMPNQDIRSLVQQIDTAKLPDTLLIAERMATGRLERFCGLGQARLAGGDESKTATASAVVNESVNNLSGDVLSVWENFLSDVGRHNLRVIRAYYPRSRVVEICGSGVTPEIWPEVGGMSRRDIVNDRGVEVVPGSSKAQNTAVEQKLLIEALQLVLGMEFVPLDTKIELTRRLFHVLGVHGVDLPSSRDLMRRQAEMEMQAQMEQQTQGGEAGQAEPTRKSMGQGVQNVGGGRVPTGASKGDRPRLVR